MQETKAARKEILANLMSVSHLNNNQIQCKYNTMEVLTGTMYIYTVIVTILNNIWYWVNWDQILFRKIKNYKRLIFIIWMSFELIQNCERCVL